MGRSRIPAPKRTPPHNITYSATQAAAHLLLNQDLGWLPPCPRLLPFPSAAAPCPGSAAAIVVAAAITATDNKHSKLQRLAKRGEMLDVEGTSSPHTRANLVGPRSTLPAHQHAGTCNITPCQRLQLQKQIVHLVAGRLFLRLW